MSKSDPFTIKTLDRSEIHVHRWIPEKPVAVLIIVHGMIEHGGRYGRLARYLTEKKIAVFAPDHRGHGRSVGEQDKWGYFGDGVRWENLANDLFCLQRHAEMHFPELPVFMLGQSMGSILTRAYISKYGEHVKGALLMGTFQNTKPLIRTGALLSQIILKLHGGRHFSNLVHQLSTGRFNTPFKPNRTEFDWISSDEMVVDEYIADDLAGHEFTVGSWNVLFKLYLAVRKFERKMEIPFHLPVLLISGDEDPVGKMGKHPQKVFSRYKKNGLKDVTLKLYRGKRHDMINETNREEVYDLIFSWINDHID
jgi:alpha-beta hydrolase superfamily lysophospholipase